MADAVVQLAPDSTGKKIQVYENTVNSQVVEAQAVVLVDSAGIPVPVVGRAAAGMANGQVTTSTTSSTLIAARTTRRTVLFRNLDPVISVWISSATATSSSGMLLKAGESITLDYSGAVYVIAASGTPIVAYMETYS